MAQATLECECPPFPIPSATKLSDISSQSGKLQLTLPLETSIKFWLAILVWWEGSTNHNLVAWIEQQTMVCSEEGSTGEEGRKVCMKLKLTCNAKLV